MENNILKNRDIIIISQQAWDTEIGSNCKDIALEFSKNNRVLYVNSPLDRITWIKRRSDPKIVRRLQVVKGKAEGLAKVNCRLWSYYPDCIVESINWLNIGFVFDFFNKINNRRLAKAILKQIKRLNFKDYLLFNDSEMFKGFYLKEYLKPRLTIYYSRDYMVGVDYWKKHGVRIEPKLIQKSDLCVTNTSFLKNYCNDFNSNTFDVGQGCNVIASDRHTQKRPEELKSIKSKIIGYAGALNSHRLDIDLIVVLALNFPSLAVVLVGAEDEQFQKSVLHVMPNVIFIGQKAHDQLSSYIQSFDVCINPQLISNITIGNYPRKIDEYLHFGKPVVATYTPTMRIFRDSVLLAHSKLEFIEFIEYALKNDNAELLELRKQVASEHSWEKSVAKIYQAINQTQSIL